MQVSINESDKTVTMALEDFYRHFTSTTANEPIKINQKHQVCSGDIEVEVTEFLGQIGMPRNIKGFNFIRQAIISTIQNPRIIDGITKELYPLIAKNNGTTPSS
ncbi:sporulation initiation factor Spo0A C-terminal domain-containing protein [Ruminiclostridium josui]|uniref:sporulation initiation factor Spo0A C-terminal domain-containing protein n=1 Tax=Ruminiclostridium josui TaxID=1499 RepID=UPI0006CFCCED|nr:sporulation initiation factor Spo0A C-terminal domain-containing protein [Ruminiclostridium josui]